MDTKVYELRTLTAGVFCTEWCGCKIKLNFVKGRGYVGHDRSTLITSDKFIQDAIENDQRFGSVFVCVAEYKNEVDAKNRHQACGQYSSSKSARGKRDLNSMIWTPEEEEPAKKSRKGKSGKTEADTTVQDKKEEQVKTFKTMNDAVYYLEEELGIDSASGDSIESLLESHGIVVEQ